MTSNSSSSSRQQIRDFVRANRWNDTNQPIAPIDHCTGSTKDEKEKLAIYAKLRQDTSYPLPIIPKLSVEMKKDRLRNAYRACLISNEILKQLNHEAEVYTNIVAVRHRVRHASSDLNLICLYMHAVSIACIHLPLILNVSPH